MKKRKRKQEKKLEVIKGVPVRRGELDLWRDPFDLFAGIQERMNQLMQFPFFEDTRRALTGRTASPKVDIYEDGKLFVVKAEVPGLKKEEISVSISEDSLTIKGERKQVREEKRKDFYRSECAYGSFQRSVSLPHRVKAKEAKAKYENGILEIRIPKAKGEAAGSVEIKLD